MNKVTKIIMLMLSLASINSYGGVVPAFFNYQGTAYGCH
jgi:hypothetical protein